MKAQPMMMADVATQVVASEEEILLEQWEAEFASEMEDFNKTKQTLENIYSDPLFSLVTPTQS